MTTNPSLAVPLYTHQSWEEWEKKKEEKYDFKSPPPGTALLQVEQIISCLKNPDPDTGLIMPVVGAMVTWLVDDLQRTHVVSKEVMDVIESERYKYEVLSVAERIVRLGPDDDDMSLRILRGVRKLTILLVDGRKKLREYENEYKQELGVSWHESICYPAPHYVFGTNPHMLYEWIHRVAKVSPLLRRVWDTKYAGVRSSGTPSMGVVSLLTLDSPRTPVAQKGGGRTLVAQKSGRRILLDKNTFKGKHVLVCCVNVPVLFESQDFQSLLNLCNELSSNRDDVEMVMVARMNIVADEKNVFDHLFSGFPTSCLAVPYEDWERRESILKKLNFNFYLPQCFLFNHTGLYLTSFMAHSVPCGAEAFPFTEDKVSEVLTKREVLRNGSLENLLRPYESSPVDVDVYELIPKDQVQKEPLRQHISDVIKGKHVGLYLCYDGSLIPHLCKLYEHCSKQESEAFEIVVLYLPYVHQMDPDIFKKNMEFKLLGQNIRWWCLPFNNSVSLRFWGLTMRYNCCSYEEEEECIQDKLIIVGGDEHKILDMYGAEVIKSHGIDGFYPFTRDALVKKKKREMKDLRLKSLLKGALFRGCDTDETISVRKLRKSKKEIIIYMGRPREYRALVSQYELMKEKKFEVVFIEYPPDYDAAGITEKREFSEMPWYVQCPLNGDYTSLATKLKEIVRGVSLVGFLAGKVCSVNRLYELFDYDGNFLDDGALGRLCSKDTLDRDIDRLFSYTSYSGI